MSVLAERARKVEEVKNKKPRHVIGCIYYELVQTSRDEEKNRRNKTKFHELSKEINSDNAGRPFNYARIKKCAVEAPNNGHLSFHRKCRPVVRLKHITTCESLIKL